MDNILSVILSSAVVVAIINNIIIVYNHNKDSRLQHITAERSEWRKEIKDIALELHETDSTSISSVLTKLKVRINAYGQYPAGDYPANDDLDYLKDVHLWKLIYNIENTNDEKDFQENKMLLINCLSGLLKFDWERSKEEVKSGKINKFVFLCAVISLGCLYANEYLNQEDFSNISTLGLIINPLLIVGLPLIIMTFPFWIDSIKTLQVANWYKRTHFVAFIIGIFFVGTAYFITSFKQPENQTDVILTSIFNTTYFTAAFTCFLNNFGKRKLYIDYDKLISKILGIPQNNKIEGKKKAKRLLVNLKKHKRGKKRLEIRLFFIKRDPKGHN